MAHVVGVPHDAHGGVARRGQQPLETTCHLIMTPSDDDAHNPGGGTGVPPHGRGHSSVATIHHRVRQPAGGRPPATGS
jgi:hypothetical protein